MCFSNSLLRSLAVNNSFTFINTVNSPLESYAASVQIKSFKKKKTEPNYSPLKYQIRTGINKKKKIHWKKSILSPRNVELLLFAHNGTNECLTTTVTITNYGVRVRGVRHTLAPINAFSCSPSSFSTSRTRPAEFIRFKLMTFTHDIGHNACNCRHWAHSCHGPKPDVPGYFW